MEFSLLYEVTQVITDLWSGALIKNTFQAKFISLARHTHLERMGVINSKPTPHFFF